MRTLLVSLHVRPSAQAVPLAAGCLKACLSNRLRQKTQLLDLYLSQPEEQHRQQILAKQPDLVAFPLYLWNRREILTLCRRLRQERPELILLAGGPEASADPRAVIEDGQLDGVICGEGEALFNDLLSAFSAGDRSPQLPGYLSAAAPADNGSVAPCLDPGELPSPWLQGDLPLQENCGVLWEVARGCTFNCAFCFDAKGLHGVRPLPWDRLRQELQLFAAKNVGQIWILDSTFNAPPERGKQLLRLLLEEAPQIHYHLEAKADFLDRETVELLGQLPCSVQIGLQSAAAEILKPLHRSFNRQQIESKLRLFSATNVTFGLDLIYGLPGDNHDGFRDSLDFALSQQPNQVDIFPLAVLPGTELFARQREFGLRAQSQPPYLLTDNRSYPQDQLQQSRRLAAATDMFYNRGRAVGFFLQLCDALNASPSDLLESFADWLSARLPQGDEQLLNVESWSPQKILPLQQDFVAEQLRRAKKKGLRRVAEDLIHYHYCCAELLLSRDCLPAADLPAEKDYLRSRWQTNPAIRIQGFNYDLEELEMLGGEPLAQIARQLQPDPGFCIFLRQQGQPVIEALDPGFAQLLRQADGRRPTEQLLNGLEKAEQMDLLRFAVEQGLLLPAT